jgi:hypothetical protein
MPVKIIEITHTKHFVSQKILREYTNVWYNKLQGMNQQSRHNFWLYNNCANK